ncbi:MAG: hypothetical protein LBH40_04460 [Alphaproteobacteria bacterium]|jgi:hypothetical protein|nr:hypothetical protein [Alphaproteobacteria bacterium]
MKDSLDVKNAIRIIFLGFITLLLASCMSLQEKQNIYNKAYNSYLEYNKLLAKKYEVNDLCPKHYTNEACKRLKEYGVLDFPTEWGILKSGSFVSLEDLEKTYHLSYIGNDWIGALPFQIVEPNFKGGSGSLVKVYTSEYTDERIFIWGIDGYRGEVIGYVLAIESSQDFNGTRTYYSLPFVIKNSDELMSDIDKHAELSKDMRVVGHEGISIKDKCGSINPPETYEEFKEKFK